MEGLESGLTFQQGRKNQEQTGMVKSVGAELFNLYTPACCRPPLCALPQKKGITLFIEEYRQTHAPAL